MRNIIHKHLPIVASFIEHEHARELEAMSEIIDSLGIGILERVYQDLIRGVSNPDKGRMGMSAEQVVRAVVIKQMNGFSYERLEFHLEMVSEYLEIRKNISSKNCDDKSRNVRMKAFYTPRRGRD